MTYLICIFFSLNRICQSRAHVVKTASIWETWFFLRRLIFQGLWRPIKSVLCDGMGFSSAALFSASLPNRRRKWPQIKISGQLPQGRSTTTSCSPTTHPYSGHTFNAQNQDQSSSEYTDEGIRFFCHFSRRVIGAAVSEAQFNDLPCGNSLSICEVDLNFSVHVSFKDFPNYVVSW